MKIEKIKGEMLVCSFCGTEEGEVDFLVEGNEGYICDICVAKASDIVELIRIAKKTVNEQFGIMLELEVKTLGFKPGTFDV